MSKKKTEKITIPSVNDVNETHDSVSNLPFEFVNTHSVNIVDENNMSPTISDGIVSKLEDYTKRILELEKDTQRNIFKIASQLQIVKEQELYKEANYTSVTDYGKNELKYKASTVSALVRIAQRFLDGNGNIIDVNLVDYSVYQLMELLQLNESELQKALTDKTIVPELTTKNMRKTVKEIKGKEEKSKKKKLKETNLNEDKEHAEEGYTSDNVTENRIGYAIAVLTKLVSDIAREERIEISVQSDYIETIKHVIETLNNN